MDNIGQQLLFFHCLTVSQEKQQLQNLHNVKKASVRQNTRKHAILTKTTVMKKMRTNTALMKN